MKTKTKIFKGLTFDILVEEAEAMDDHGGRLWYLASIYVRERGASERTLVRRSRLPGAADELTAAIRLHGIRVFDGYKPSQRDVAKEGAGQALAKRPGQPQQRPHGGARQQRVP